MTDVRSHHCLIKDPRSGMRSRRNGPETRFDRSTKSLSCRRDRPLQKLCSHKAHRARLGFIPKDRMHIVDGGGSVVMMGISSSSPGEKRTIKKSEDLTGRQTENGYVVSTLKVSPHKRSWYQSLGSLVTANSISIIYGRLCNELG